MRPARLALLCLALLYPLSLHAQNDCSLLKSTGAYAPLGTFRPFPASSPFNTAIASSPVDPLLTAAFVKEYGAAHARPNVAMPYNVVDSSTKAVTVVFAPGSFPDESDIVPMPIDAATRIENNPPEGVKLDPGQDHHAFVLDRSSCWLYEAYQVFRNAGTVTILASTAIWDMQNGTTRPYGMTSTDAAGLPIFPLLLTVEDVASGHVTHPLRMTFNHARQGANGSFYFPPATHGAGDCCWGDSAIMGMRLRLRADFDISPFTPAAQTVLRGMREYGIYVADLGMTGLYQTTDDPRWSRYNLGGIDRVPLSAFEVIKSAPLLAARGDTAKGEIYSPILPAPATDTGGMNTRTVQGHLAGKEPKIKSVAVNPATGMLSCSVPEDATVYLEEVGPARGCSLIIPPTFSGQHLHLVAQNSYGRARVSLKVPAIAGAPQPHP